MNRSHRGNGPFRTSVLVAAGDPPRPQDRTGCLAKLPRTTHSRGGQPTGGRRLSNAQVSGPCAGRHVGVSNGMDSQFLDRRVRALFEPAKVADGLNDEELVHDSA